MGGQTLRGCRRSRGHLRPRGDPPVQRLYDAKLDHVPVVAIVGQTARSAMGGSYQQEVDLRAQFKDVASEYLVERDELTGAGVAKALLGKDVVGSSVCATRPRSILSATTQPPGHDPAPAAQDRPQLAGADREERRSPGSCVRWAGLRAALRRWKQGHLSGM